MIFSLSTRWVNLIIFLGILLLTILRFVHLQADFPEELTDSGDLYTDEGWYSNSATAYSLTGNWYVAGDFNPAVNLPVFPLAQALSFKTLGLSIISARITPLVFFGLLLLALYYFLKKQTPANVTLGALALLSVNYVCFAYSRLAFQEIPMTFFLVLSFLLAAVKTEKVAIFGIILSALAFLAAILTKTSAFFALPLCGYLIWNKETTPNKYLQLLLFLGVLMAGLLLYYWLLVAPHLVDYQYFTSLNITSRLSARPLILFQGLLKAIINGLIIDEILYPLALLCGIGFLFFSKSLRQNNLFRFSLMWIILYLAMLSINNYTPYRYYLPLAVPVFILLAVVLDYLLKALKTSWFAYILILAILISTSLNIFNIVKYLSSSEYSFASMAADIKQYIVADRRPGTNNVLLGNFANSLSLATGVFSLNDRLGTQPLAFKIKKYRPAYYVTLGPLREEERLILQLYYKNIEQITTYNVFHNYYDENPVFFYKLHL